MQRTRQHAASRRCPTHWRFRLGTFFPQLGHSLGYCQGGKPTSMVRTLVSNQVKVQSAWSDLMNLSSTVTRSGFKFQSPVMVLFRKLLERPKSLSSITWWSVASITFIKSDDDMWNVHDRALGASGPLKSKGSFVATALAVTGSHYDLLRLCFQGYRPV